MFDTKNFVAFMAFNNSIREMFFDMVEEKGIDSRWDTFHVLDGDESVPSQEVQIMEGIYISEIKDNPENESAYNKSLQDFRKNLRNKINRRLSHRKSM